MSAEKKVPIKFWDDLYKSETMPWDAGETPERLLRFLDSLERESGCELLVPGCGSAYEAGSMASKGFDVKAIDFSEEAIKRAASVLDGQKVVLEQANYFDYEGGPFDYIYERAFLCSFKPDLRTRFLEKLRSLLKPGGLYFGFFFVAPTREDGPPYPVPDALLRDMMKPHFELREDEVHQEQLEVFGGSERWQVWAHL